MFKRFRQKLNEYDFPKWGIDAVVLLVVDALWVFLSVVAAGAIGMLFPESIRYESAVQCVGLLFFLLLTGILMLVRVKLWLIPLGGIYMRLLLSLFIHDSIFPGRFLDPWGLRNEGGMFSFNGYQSAVALCIYSVLLQLVLCLYSRLWRWVKRAFTWEQKGRASAADSVKAWEKWLRFVGGSLLWTLTGFWWVGGEGVRYFSTLTAFITDFNVQFWVLLPNILIGLILFPLMLRTWKEFLLCLPLTVLASGIFLLPIFNVPEGYTATRQAVGYLVLTVCIQIVALPVWRIIKPSEEDVAVPVS
ncbi:MAG: hypothetical protein IJX47_07820 [Clostridia bacterium]|nr:hypothetical protein [Clostridia bacterium]